MSEPRTVMTENTLSMDQVRQRRYRNWHQTQDTRIRSYEEAVPLIERLGVVTLFPVSDQVASCFHAYVGDPNAKTDPGWDTPSGEVYTWRWHLGRHNVAAYVPFVRKRPTWVSWDLLPAVLRLRADGRMPDELFDLGVISADAYRIAQALERSGGVLSTGRLREEAGFPTGKEQRTAFLRAIAELDGLLLLAKTFVGDEEDMYHALIPVHFREYAAEADRMSSEDALRLLLARYLPEAVFAVPGVLSRHLGIPQEELEAGLLGLVEEGAATAVVPAGEKRAVYVTTS